MELSSSIVHPDFLQYLGYSSWNGPLYLVCNPMTISGSETYFFWHARTLIRISSLDELERLGQIPGVGVPVAPRGKLVNAEPSELAGFPPEVRDVNDDKSLCGLWI